MIHCNDFAGMIGFLSRAAVRHRLLLHDLDPPCPLWDDAMHRCDYVHGIGFVLWPTAAVTGHPSETVYYVDRPAGISLLVRVRGKHAEVEGTVCAMGGTSLLQWLVQAGVQSVTTHGEQTRDGLSAAHPLDWMSDGADYTVTPEGFAGGGDWPVRRLVPGDHWAWREFVRRNASDPMVNGHCGSQSVVRDFVFLCSGLPVEFYAAFDGEQIAGVASVNPMTRTVDEIGMLFVDPQYRRQGAGRSLVSVATRDILARGHQPAYHAAGDPTGRPDLYNMLTSLGYQLVACPWQAELPAEAGSQP